MVLFSNLIVFSGPISDHTYRIDIFNATCRHTFRSHKRMALPLCVYSFRRNVRYILGYEEVGSVAEEDCLLDESETTRRRRIPGGREGLFKRGRHPQAGFTQQ